MYHSKILQGGGSYYLVIIEIDNVQSTYLASEYRFRLIIIFPQLVLEL